MFSTIFLHIFSVSGMYRRRTANGVELSSKYEAKRHAPSVYPSWTSVSLTTALTPSLAWKWVVRASVDPLITLWFGRTKIFSRLHSTETKFMEHGKKEKKEKKKENFGETIVPSYALCVCIITQASTLFLIFERKLFLTLWNLYVYCKAAAQCYVSHASSIFLCVFVLLTCVCKDGDCWN